MEPLMDVEGLGQALNMAVQTIYNKLSRHPDTLPPRLQLPCRKPLWRPEVVQAWLSSFPGGNPTDITDIVLHNRNKTTERDKKGGGKPRGPRNKKYRREV
jgi:predicted DNA-binding transcriptional regulator AlpA